MANIQIPKVGLFVCFSGGSNTGSLTGIAALEAVKHLHAAVTAAQHDIGATAMHITGAIKAGASAQELLETAFTLILVAGMPSFAIFLEAWRKVQEVK